MGLIILSDALLEFTTTVRSASDYPRNNQFNPKIQKKKKSTYKNVGRSPDRTETFALEQQSTFSQNWRAKGVSNKPFFTRLFPTTSIFRTMLANLKRNAQKCETPLVCTCAGSPFTKWGRDLPATFLRPTICTNLVDLISFYAVFDQYILAANSEGSKYRHIHGYRHRQGKLIHANYPCSTAARKIQYLGRGSLVISWHFSCYLICYTKSTIIMPKPWLSLPRLVKPLSVGPLNMRLATLEYSRLCPA